MIYLDYQATTPVAPEVAAAMRPWIEEGFGNPHSAHRPGREAAAAVEVAREKILSALALGAAEASPAGRIFFTSGATEAANWALKGAAARLPASRRRIVTLATEHACVLDTMGWLAAQGFEVDILPVRSDGLVDLDVAAARITGETGLVAAMLVNNEIGVIQPVADLAALARGVGALFFCDAVQALGRVPIPLPVCDMVAVSAHKVHGPKGIGALWLREGTAIDPLLHGGGQEGGLRSGTLSPALCVGFGEAARLLAARAGEDEIHVGRLWSVARAALCDWSLNGSGERRYRGNLNLRREGLDSARLLSEVREVAISAGSACASGSGRPSHVLSALGLSEREARSSIRIGFGRYTKEEDLVRALSLIADAANRQQAFAA
ncbi:cysteine desulfurase family protein [Sphingosinicella sp. BN140058]|uniref:cysteine desulfurase family protein n=1 Tax=Sphingosinicella sp. BN140058 TaxID=1892855 RepID=UPI001012D4D3|nr:cysteine desulfurase family protein [Sphingosinicella sp. BN140058]QAY78620.1 cysteine desulfurase [Sphingosinicella sp. BN140058]